MFLSCLHVPLQIPPIMNCQTLVCLFALVVIDQRFFVCAVSLLYSKERSP